MIILKDYYSKKLSSGRLRQAYDRAPDRVRRYLESEIQFVKKKIKSGDLVLELGCGYGRVMNKLTEKTEKVIGIDTSIDSLYMAKKSEKCSSFWLLAMNAVKLGFYDQCFDLVICVQNGISAFNVNQEDLIKEALRVTRSGGKVLFSSYSEQFWPDRLNWFRIQAEHGLVGEIDEEATGNGVIVCKDGFRATTVGPEDFRVLTSRIGLTVMITKVNGSSIFCEIEVP
jgi:2-polyprenyl-6-hydroxyphenyl methylase/3-demethylubiquinone-9 3-methyltransferase